MKHHTGASTAPSFLSLQNARVSNIISHTGSSFKFSRASFSSFFPISPSALSSCCIYDSIRHSSAPISFVSSSWLSENKSTCHRHLLIEKFMYSADLLATGSVFFLFDKYTMMWETETSWSIHSNNVNTIVIYEFIVCWRPTVLNIDTQHDSMARQVAYLLRVFLSMS